MFFSTSQATAFAAVALIFSSAGVGATPVTARSSLLAVRADAKCGLEGVGDAKASACQKLVDSDWSTLQYIPWREDDAGGVINMDGCNVYTKGRLDEQPTKDAIKTIMGCADTGADKVNGMVTVEGTGDDAKSVCVSDDSLKSAKACFHLN